MKPKNKDRSMLYAVIAGAALFALPFFLLALSLFEEMCLPKTIGIPFPKRTIIIERTDTFDGIIRENGKRLVVARIPTKYRESFAEQLKGQNFSTGAPPDNAKELLRQAAHPDVRAAFSAERALWTHSSDFILVFPNDVPDGFAAIYDPDTGICCCVEIDDSGNWLWD